MKPTVWRRSWAMPSADTFSIECVGAFVGRHLSDIRSAGGVIVDPFARRSRWGTITNDLDPEMPTDHHMDAAEFLRMLACDGVVADAVIFDPPYSPRQIAECYQRVGLRATMEDTQTARMKRELRRLIRRIIRIGGKVLSFGWNTVGMGEEWHTDEILLVCHGGDHNDTICLAQTHDTSQPMLIGTGGCVE